MGKEQIEQLETHGKYVSVPSGISMRPMIYGKKDAVMIEKISCEPKRYDLVMYIRGEQQGVIHRVIRKRDEDYVICGDNCWQLEYVKPEQIRGIATEFYRKGKWHSVDEKAYKLYVHIWVDFLFIKRPIFYVRDKIKHRLKRKNSR